MDLQDWEKLRACCRDDAAFEQMQEILGLKTAQVTDNIPVIYENKPKNILPPLHQFLEHSDDILIEYDQNLRYIWINQAGAKMLGLTPAEIIGKTNRELLGSAGNEIEKTWQKVLDHGQQIQVEYRIQLPTMSKIYDTVYKPIKDENGVIASVIGIGHNVTELRSLQQTSEQMLAQAYYQVEQRKALAEVIVRIRELLDLDRIFQATTKEVRHLLNADRVAIFQFYPDSGYNDGEFISENLIAGLDSALTAKVHDRCFGNDYALYYQEGKIQAVSNIYTAGLSDCHIKILSQFQVKANLVVPLLKGRNLWGLLCIHQCTKSRQWEETEIEFVNQIASHLGVALQQIELLAQTKQQAEQIALAMAELQKTQAQLIQNEKMSSLGHLIAGIAHEINNPVNFIYGNLSHASDYTNELLDILRLYQQFYPQPHPDLQEQAQAIDLEFISDDLPKLLSSMKVGADRIRQLVLSLRNFSRIDQSERKLVNIHEGIESSLVILQHRLKSKTINSGIQVIKNYGELPLVDCYPGQLNQVFMNILCNAIDALEDQPEPRIITIRTQFVSGKNSLAEAEITTNKVIIQIADNGPGIPPAVQTRIFDPFFTTKDPGKGTGLGLAISYQIVVEKHGGAFYCISEPGVGTELWIEIPFGLEASD